MSNKQFINALGHCCIDHSLFIDHCSLIIAAPEGGARV